MATVALAAVRLLAVMSLLLAGLAEPTHQIADDSPWYEVDDTGDVLVHFYFAYSTTCPHCATASPWVEEIDETNDWLVVHDLPLNVGDTETVELAISLAEEIGEDLRSVPSFMYCEKMAIGFSSAETTGAAITADLEECHAQLQAELGTGSLSPPVDDTEERAIQLPIVGEVDPETMSLPAFTVLVASLDAFNPCAFFVLLFLLSLLVHARSRARMATIGGTFVLISGLAYFAFMVAWLNVFLVFGALPAVTVAAGAVALLIAALNIKDYFWLGQGPSLSIPEKAKPGLFSRMRTLTTSTSFPLMMAGTVTLAVAANSYELLCTAGFPLVFTRVLTLNELPTLTYYGYLVLYNVVYVIPLLAIVTVFVWTLGSRKLSERGGRILKLTSGLMMAGLGGVLLLAPTLMENTITAPLVMVGALGLTGIIVLVDRRRRRGEVSLPSSSGLASR